MPENEKNIKSGNSWFSRLNRELLIFLVFLFISAALWLIQTFKDSMSMPVDYELNIVNKPESVVITSDIPEKISVRLYGRGFQLLRMIFSSQAKQLDIDYNNIRSNGELLVIENEHWKRAFDRVLPKGLNVNERSLPRLELFYTNGAPKKVPVLFCGKVSWKEDYVITDTVLLPSYVLAYGPASKLDALTAIRTDTVSFQNLDQTSMAELKLLPPLGVKCRPEHVNAEVRVDMISEQTYEVQILAKNCPQDSVLKAFPTNANVTCRGRISRLKEINPDNFSVTIDYDSVRIGGDRCRVRLEQQPEGVTVIRQTPDYVEYIIEPVSVNED